jgi:hypothetical protein
MAETKPIPSGGDGLIGRYNRMKRYCYWLLLAFFVLGITYTVLVAWSDQQKSLLDEGRLGPDLVSNGKTVVVTAILDKLQEILVSVDSGKHFDRTGDTWPLRDSSLFLGIAPDSETIIGLEKNGILHRKPGGELRFLEDTLHLPYDSAFNGFVFIPQTDSLLAFGQSNSIMQVNWKDLSHRSFLVDKDFPKSISDSLEGVLPTVVKAMAISPEKRFAAICFQKPYLSIATGFCFQPLAHSAEHPDTTKWDHLSLGYDQKKQVFFYEAARQGILFSRWAIDAMKPQLDLDTAQFPATQLLIDTAGLAVYYGNGPFIQQGKNLDSIPQGGVIRALAMQDNRPSLVIVQNFGNNYLFQNKGSGWSLNPVMTIDHSLDWWVVYFFIATFFAFWLMIYCYVASRRLRIRLIQPIVERTTPLLTKSERPLGRGDDDLLGFSAVESAITRIIRNPLLDLPMTIVISGNWGSGKSSMMNRIRESLQHRKLRRRFMTSWFNAWHLQGEANLLNTFLLNIIDCYERSYSGISAFRLKIAVSRYMRLHFWKKLAFGFALALLAPFLLLLVAKVLPGGDSHKWDWLGGYCKTITGIFFNSGGWDKKIVEPIGAGLLILLSIIFVNRQFIPAGLSTFFQLLPHEDLKLDVEKADIGSREKFRQQYWEIMGAAKKGVRLVIFIDDLDRIAGDRILELLEGINFISDIASRPPDAGKTIPNTIFVLGMYTKEVARLVGTQLNKVNSSDLPPEQLGMLYIEKMVQLIVPVPFDSSDKEKLQRLYEN